MNNLNHTAINPKIPAASFVAGHGWRDKQAPIRIWWWRTEYGNDDTHDIGEFSLIPPQDAAIVEPPKAAEPVNTVDEWLPVTNEQLLRAGDQWKSPHIWYDVDQCRFNQYPAPSVRYRRRNPDYKPPFVPRPATWPDVKPGAVLEYNDTKVRVRVEQVGDNYFKGINVADNSNWVGGKIRIDERAYTLIQAAPIDSSEAKK